MNQAQVKRDVNRAPHRIASTDQREAPTSEQHFRLATIGTVPCVRGVARSEIIRQSGQGPSPSQDHSVNPLDAGDAGAVVVVMDGVVAWLHELSMTVQDGVTPECGATSSIS